jgi:hypothetical protein
VAYEEKALKEVCNDLNVQLRASLPEVSGLDRIIMNEIIFPWGILKKFNHRGSVHSLCFKSPLQQVADMENLTQKVCQDYGYSADSIGAYVLPMERGRAMHCEFDLHCDLENIQETQAVKDLWLRASELLLNQGAYFDRPYGAWAEMVFQRSGTHTRKLKEIKQQLDPRGILNPGKLCF